MITVAAIVLCGMLALALAAAVLRRSAKQMREDSIPDEDTDPELVPLTFYNGSEAPCRSEHRQ